MKPIFKQTLFCVAILFSITTIAQKLPKSGTYTYQMKMAEHAIVEGKETIYQNGQKLKVVIKKDSVFVYTTDNSIEKFKQGSLLQKGKLFYHTKFKKWIIVANPEDENATEVGGCSGGPTEIDIKKKWYWEC